MKLNKEMIITILVSTIISVLVVFFILSLMFSVEINIRNKSADPVPRQDYYRLQAPQPELLPAPEHRRQELSDIPTRDSDTMFDDYRNALNYYNEIVDNVFWHWPSREWWNNFDILDADMDDFDTYTSHYHSFAGFPGEHQRYRRFVFKPASQKKLTLNREEITPMKSLCGATGSQNAHKVRYNIYSSDVHGLIWQEVSLADTEAAEDTKFGVSWAVDFYTPLEDMRMIDEDLHIKLKDEDVVFILDRNTGIIKKQESYEERRFNNSSADMLCE